MHMKFKCPKCKKEIKCDGRTLRQWEKTKAGLKSFCEEYGVDVVMKRI